jgi:hypothetical protein
VVGPGGRCQVCGECSHGHDALGGSGPARHGRPVVAGGGEDEDLRIHLGDQVERHVDRQQRLVVDRVDAQRQAEDAGTVPDGPHHGAGDVGLAPDAVAVDGPVHRESGSRVHLLDDARGEGPVAGAVVEEAVGDRQVVERVDVVVGHQPRQPAVRALLCCHARVHQRDGHLCLAPRRRGREGQCDRGRLRAPAALHHRTERRDVVDRGLVPGRADEPGHVRQLVDGQLGLRVGQSQDPTGELLDGHGREAVRGERVEQRRVLRRVGADEQLAAHHSGPEPVPQLDQAERPAVRPVRASCLHRGEQHPPVGVLSRRPAQTRGLPTYGVLVGQALLLRRGSGWRPCQRAAPDGGPSTLRAMLTPCLRGGVRGGPQPWPGHTVQATCLLRPAIEHLRAGLAVRGRRGPPGARTGLRPLRRERPRDRAPRRSLLSVTCTQLGGVTPRSTLLAYAVQRGGAGVEAAARVVRRSSASRRCRLIRSVERQQDGFADVRHAPAAGRLRRVGAHHAVRAVAGHRDGHRRAADQAHHSLAPPRCR